MASATTEMRIELRIADRDGQFRGEVCYTQMNTAHAHVSFSLTFLRFLAPPYLLPLLPHVRLPLLVGRRSEGRRISGYAEPVWVSTHTHILTCRRPIFQHTDNTYYIYNYTQQVKLSEYQLC